MVKKSRGSPASERAEETSMTTEGLGAAKGCVGVNAQLARRSRWQLQGVPNARDRTASEKGIDRR